MKSLKPSMRENKRYLLVVGEGNGNLKENIEKAILDFNGIRGLSKCGLGFIKSEGNKAIISINREAVDIVRASLAIGSEKISVKKVSGTLKGLKTRD